MEYQHVKPVRVNFLLRDSDQSLQGGRERIERKVEKMRLAQATGVDDTEIWGGTQVEVPARFKAEHPFKEGLKPLSEASQNVRRTMLLRSQSGNGRRIFSDEAIRLEMDVITRDDQITVIRAFDATNNMDNMHTVFEQAKALQAEGRNFKLQAAMSYSLSEPAEGDPEDWTYRTPDFYVRLADEYIAAGADEICFKDMAGTMKPEDATYMVRAIKARHPDVELTLHMHASSGQSLATLAAAIKAGVDTVDVGADGMCDWVGHTSLQDLLWYMENSDDPELKARMPEIDRNALEQLSEHNYESRDHHRNFELPFDIEVQQAIVKAKLPGGMATTLLNNISQLYQGKASKDEIKTAFLESLKEIPHVARDLGHLELVTPTSDIVGKQAVYNWFYGEKGQDRYAVFGPGFADYVLGKQGYSQNKPKEDIIQMVETRQNEQRYEGRPADRVDPNEVQNVRNKLAELSLDPNDDVDVLTALMSGDDGCGYAFLMHYYGGDMSKVKTYTPEEPPKPSPYLSSTAPTRSGYLGMKEEVDALGATFAERLIQKAQKYQMIVQGASFVGINDEVKAVYLDKLHESIQQDLEEVSVKLKAAGFKDAQILTRVFEAVNGVASLPGHIKDRAKTLGVSDAFLPVFEERPDYMLRHKTYEEVANEKFPKFEPEDGQALIASAE